tara:strand:+ start:9660 stop:9884 length:225 start_codon:yes stop_codon:yes gene_type:complete
MRRRFGGDEFRRWSRQGRIALSFLAISSLHEFKQTLTDQFKITYHKAHHFRRISIKRDVLLAKLAGNDSAARQQ